MLKLPDKYTARDLATVLRRRVEYCPDKNWIVTAHRGYSYREMDIRSGQLAQGLVDFGIASGDTVLIMLPDIVDYVLTWCALSKFGGVEVPVNVHNRGNPLAYLINDSLAKTLIIDVRFLDRIDAIKAELTSLKKLILYDEQESYQCNTISLLESKFEVHRYNDIFAEEIYSGPSPSYRDLMGVLYTSGTTGPSKGVMTTHGHAYEYAFGVTEMLELKEDDIYCAPLPLFHIAGLFATIYSSCIVGATAVIPGTFSVERFWRDIAHYHPVTCFFSP